MRPILATAIATLSLALVALSQEDAPKAKVSSDPLTEEQIAVYRTVFDSYSNGSNATLNVADQTETLDLSEDKDCLKGIDLDPGNTSTSVVHRLDNRVTKMKKNIVPVNGELQQKKVEENDPQKLMKRAIDGGERVTEKQLDGSLREAFATGLFAFSEIAFDKRHQHAVLAYSFVCGGLCGHGNTIVLRKVGGKWKQRKTCRSWIS
jgi:hypothetical protein